ncbi:hypothetical protein ACIQVE_25210 [Pseudomonas sp. NPDC098747]|uniref:hypothetical protein n=1 Tax=Pseudomonas sp. NPDC098747 TaxID=3364487 RepID=UPI00383B8089
MSTIITVRYSTGVTSYHHRCGATLAAGDVGRCPPGNAPATPNRLMTYRADGANHTATIPSLKVIPLKREDEVMPEETVEPWEGEDLLPIGIQLLDLTSV